MANTALADAVRNLPTFRGRDRRAFRAYLYRILRRRLADEVRRQASQPRIAYDISCDDALSETIVDEISSTFDDRLVDTQATEHLLSHLTEEQREVVEMRVMTGLSIRETADNTGRSVTAVKAMQRRALVSLRAIVTAAAIIIAGLIGFQVLNSIGDKPVTIVNDPVGDDGRSGQDGTDADSPEDRSDSDSDTESRADEQSQSAVDASSLNSGDDAVTSGNASSSNDAGDSVLGARTAVGTSGSRIGAAVTGPAAFPGAVGWAAETTTGGRGGRVVIVDSLANTVNPNDGIMTFREAMTEIDEPRIIVFSVAGQINYANSLGLPGSQLLLNGTDSDVTVACQSAPEPGVTFVGDGIRFSGDASNVIMRHCRMRNSKPTNAGSAGNSSCLRVMGTQAGPVANDYVLDHVSCMWTAANSIVFSVPANGQSTGGNIEDVTISNSISAEGDTRSYTGSSGDEDPNATTMGCSSAQKARKVARCSLVGNFMAHNLKQNARLWGVEQGEMSNNIVYNFSSLGLQAKARTPLQNRLDGSIIANLVKYGPNSKSSSDDLYRPIDLSGNTKANTFVDVTGNYVAEVGKSPTLVENPLYDNDNSALKPAPSTTNNILAMAQSDSSHLRCVGASRPQRDSHDQRVIDEFIQGTGKQGVGANGVRDFSEYSSSPTRHPWADNDGDGMPDAWEQKVGVEDPNGNDLSSTYSNVEVYINGLAQCPSVQADLSEGKRFSSGTTEVAVPFSTNWLLWDKGQTMEVCVDGNCRDYTDPENDQVFVATELSAGEHTVRLTPKSPSGSAVGVTDQVKFTIG